MKTIILSILTLVISATWCNAQVNNDDPRETVMVGLKAGINVANVYSTRGDNFQTSSRIGFAGGGFIVIPIIALIGIQPEVLFSQKGYNGNGSILGSSYNVTHTTNFLDVPIFLAIKPSSMFTILVGPQYSYLLSQKDVFTSGSLTHTQEQTFNNDNARKNILCFVAGFDLNFQHCVFGARVGWDVQDNKGDGSSSDPQYKNEWIQATLGVRL